mmetsp:Transcript_74409/g.164330  ORF Transcript_74409/g.164330 Transcript_74409/m.164330 type:complete len:303 (-) Transcript_74409:669-1577(-)
MSDAAQRRSTVCHDDASPGWLTASWKFASFPPLIPLAPSLFAQDAVMLLAIDGAAGPLAAARPAGSSTAIATLRPMILAVLGSFNAGLPASPQQLVATPNPPAHTAPFDSTTRFQAVKVAAHTRRAILIRRRDPPPGRPPAAGHVTALPAMDPTAAARGAEDVGAGHSAPGSLATADHAAAAAVEGTAVARWTQGVACIDQAPGKATTARHVAPPASRRNVSLTSPASRAPLILHLDTAACEARTAADRAPSGTVKTATDAGQAQEVRLLDTSVACRLAALHIAFDISTMATTGSPVPHCRD